MSKEAQVTVGAGRNQLDQGYQYYPADGSRQSSFIQVYDKELIANLKAVKKAAKTIDAADFTRVIAWDDVADAMAEQLDADRKITVLNIERKRTRTLKLRTGARQQQVEIVIGKIDGMDDQAVEEEAI